MLNMDPADLPVGEITSRGARIYEQKLRSLLEPEHIGKYLVIDIESGEYEMDKDYFSAADRAVAKFGRGSLYSTRVGYVALCRIGGHFRGDWTMIVGSVRENGDAVVSIGLLGARSLQREVDCIVDTGFNEGLTLPPDLIGALELPSLGGTTFTLADGSEGFTSIFDASVEWFGQLRRVIVLELDGNPLIGMAMLRGSRVTIDVVPDGPVGIEPLPTAP